MYFLFPFCSQPDVINQKLCLFLAWNFCYLCMISTFKLANEACVIRRKTWKSELYLGLERRWEIYKTCKKFKRDLRKERRSKTVTSFFFLRGQNSNQLKTQRTNTSYWTIIPVPPLIDITSEARKGQGWTVSRWWTRGKLVVCLWRWKQDGLFHACTQSWLSLTQHATTSKQLYRLNRDLA